jgi:hypothetical protein
MSHPRRLLVTLSHSPVLQQRLPAPSIVRPSQAATAELSDTYRKQRTFQYVAASKPPSSSEPYDILQQHISKQEGTGHQTNLLATIISRNTSTASRKNNERREGVTEDQAPNNQSSQYQ